MADITYERPLIYLAYPGPFVLVAAVDCFVLLVAHHFHCQDTCQCTYWSIFHQGSLQLSRRSLYLGYTHYFRLLHNKASLLYRLCADPLQCNCAISKINLFSKIAVTCKPMLKIFYFMTVKMWGGKGYRLNK